MAGQQHIQKQKQFLCAFRVAVFVVACIFLLSACSEQWLLGDGRGDWSKKLFNGYYIIRVNSRCVMLGYKEKDTDNSWNTVLNNLYITAFQTDEPFILLECIQTKGEFVTEEEMSAHRCYYCVDAETGSIEGPFLSYELLFNYCSSNSILLTEKWQQTER